MAGPANNELMVAIVHMHNAGYLETVMIPMFLHIIYLVLNPLKLKYDNRQNLNVVLALSRLHFQ